MGNIIAFYYGDLNNIPKRWKLCNGEDGTPNLEDLFVRGAFSSSLRPPMQFVDAKKNHIHTTNAVVFSHSHVVEPADNHQHSLLLKSDYPDWEPYIFSNGSGSSEERTRYTDYSDHIHSCGSSGGSHSHQTAEVEAPDPPYFYLAYVMAEDDIYYEFPVGAIAMWCGHISEIPPDWKFCDGNNGTIDLRDKFIMGAVTDEDIGKTGNGKHSHSIPTSGAHTHNVVSGGSSHRHIDVITGGRMSSGTSRAVNSAGSSHIHAMGEAGEHSHSVLSEEYYPAYYSLAYIQKIS